jgi:hypothetical protein
MLQKNLEADFPVLQFFSKPTVHRLANKFRTNYLLKKDREHNIETLDDTERILGLKQLRGNR